MREDSKRTVILHDKLCSEEGTFTFGLKHEEIVKVDDRRHGNIATKDSLPDDTPAAVTAGRTLRESQTGTAPRGPRI